MQLGTAMREYWVGGSFPEAILLILVGGPLGESLSLALLNRPIRRDSYGFLWAESMGQTSSPFVVTQETASTVLIIILLVQVVHCTSYKSMASTHYSEGERRPKTYNQYIHRARMESVNVYIKAILLQRLHNARYTHTSFVPRPSFSDSCSPIRYKSKSKNSAWERGQTHTCAYSDFLSSCTPHVHTFIQSHSAMYSMSQCGNNISLTN